MLISYLYLCIIILLACSSMWSLQATSHSNTLLSLECSTSKENTICNWTHIGIVCVCLCVHVHPSTCRMCGGQKTAFRSWFSPLQRQYLSCGHCPAAHCGLHSLWATWSLPFISARLLGLQIEARVPSFLHGFWELKSCHKACVASACTDWATSWLSFGLWHSV